MTKYIYERDLIGLVIVPPAIVFLNGWDYSELLPFLKELHVSRKYLKGVNIHHKFQLYKSTPRQVHSRHCVHTSYFTVRGMCAMFTMYRESQKT